MRSGVEKPIERLMRAAEPALRFRVRIDAAGPPVQAILLRCQIRIEPARRRYTATEQARLLELFGTPERWGQTLRSLLFRAKLRAFQLTCEKLLTSKSSVFDSQGLSPR